MGCNLPPPPSSLPDPSSLSSSKEAGLRQHTGLHTTKAQTLGRLLGNYVTCYEAGELESSPYESSTSF